MNYKEKLIEELDIPNKLLTELSSTICLFPGSFSPPHRSHFEIVERASSHVDEVHIIIANNVREGYTPELSLKIWEQYKKLLPDNVKVYISKDPSPITEVYSVVKDKSNNYIVVYGKGEQDRYNSINENRDKYSNVDIVDAGQIGDISATKLREAIKTRNKLAIKSLIPEGIKVDDFLMNFQIHEDKIPGGLAQGKTIPDIAKHHKERPSTILLQLANGIEVEMEHTTSKKVAKEIAMDHLWEDPKYYDKLASIEENIEESKNLGTLYHFTNINNASNILKSNQIVASTTTSSDYQRDFQFFRKKGEEVRDKGLDYLTFVSLTRDKLLYKKFPKLSVAPMVRFELDGNKLSSKYKISPFNYYADDIEDETDRFKSNEGEERVNLYTKGEIPNLDRYINKVYIILDLIEDNESYLKQAKELISKYPGKVISLYKEKPMSIEEYEKTILPSIEPFRDEEFLEEASKAIDRVFGKKLNEDIQVNPELYIELLNKCIKECCEELKIPPPKIEIINDSSYTDEHKSYGGYLVGQNEIKLVIYGRLLKDVCVTLCHELRHHYQYKNNLIKPGDGEDGDEIENDSNSFAGSYLRKFGRNNPEIYFMKYN